MIELVQGDTSLVYKFQRKNQNGEVITELPEKMWITFKKNCCDSACLFQKTLSDGTIEYDEDDNFYRFQILPDDTCNLLYGDYGFDIAIKKSDEIKKRTLKNDGVLRIVKHYTHKNNE